MALHYRGSLSGFSNTYKHLDRILDQLNGADTKMYHDIGVITNGSIHQNFNAEGRPTWEERKHDYPWPILNKSGLMRLQAQTSALQPWIHTKYQHILNIYSTDYANYHQYGTSKLPIRAFIKFTIDELNAIRERLRKAFK